jgi:putative transposase
MQNGNRYRWYPTRAQKCALPQAIGCQRFVYNAKTEEDRYYRGYARKFASNVYAPTDQEYSRFIGPQTAWLKDVPSQVLRNGATKWRQAYARFFRGLGGRPKIRKRHGKQSVWLTRELFEFTPVRDEAGGITGYDLTVGTRKWPFGKIDYRCHRPFTTLPNSIHLSMYAGQYWLSFSTDDGEPEYSEQEIADHLASFGREHLAAHSTGGDLGVAIPLAMSDGREFDFMPKQKKRVRRRLKVVKRLQKKQARQVKGSRRREVTKRKIAVLHRKNGCVRHDFAHQTSHAITSGPRTLLIGLEDLQIKNMAASAKGTIEEPGRNVRQKAGLSRSIHASAWGLTRTFSRYKARRLHKLVVLAPPHHSSQECRICGHINKDNRVSQSEFVCQDCGHTENADHNAASIVKMRAVDIVASGQWCAKEVKRTKITRTKVRQELPEPVVVAPIAATLKRVGAPIRHRRQTMPVHGPVNREDTPPKALRA